MKRNYNLTRPGSKPRIIFYSQTSKGHSYDYNKPILEITGKDSRHIPQKPSGDLKFLQKIKVHPQPNTGRTINPNLYKTEKETNNQNNNSNQIFPNTKTGKKIIPFRKTNNFYGTMDKTFKEIKEKKQMFLVKINKKKNITSEDLLKNFKNFDENEKNNDYTHSRNYNKNKLPNKQFSSFQSKKKYDLISEIVNLPGGVKCEEKEIKDDYYENSKKKKSKIIKNSTASSFKHKNIYSSEVELKNINNNNDNNNFLENNYNNNYIIKENNNHKKANSEISNIVYSSNELFYPDYYGENAKNTNNNLERNNYNSNFYNNNIKIILDNNNMNNYTRSKSSRNFSTKIQYNLKLDNNRKKNEYNSNYNTNYFTIKNDEGYSNNNNEFITNYMQDYKYRNSFINQTDSIKNLNTCENYPKSHLIKRLNHCNTNIEIKNIQNMKGSFGFKKKNKNYFNSSSNANTNNNLSANYYNKTNYQRNKDCNVESNTDYFYTKNVTIDYNSYYGAVSNEKKQKKNDMFITNNQRKKNFEYHNIVFNEKHQEKPLSIKTNYSKRNFSQFVLS